jgi:hypothetical protein
MLVSFHFKIPIGIDNHVQYIEEIITFTASPRVVECPFTCHTYDNKPVAPATVTVRKLFNQNKAL